MVGTFRFIEVGTGEQLISLVKKGLGRHQAGLPGVRTHGFGPEVDFRVVAFDLGLSVDPECARSSVLRIEVERPPTLSVRSLKLRRLEVLLCKVKVFLRLGPI
jgi:hypothetical protein